MADPSTTPASPFNPPVSANQVPREGPGCSKPLLLGCGAVMLLFAIGFVVLLSQAPAIGRWWFHTLEATLEPRLPADLTAAERQRLHRAFAAAGRAAASGQTDIGSLQPFQRKVMALSNPQVPITHKDVRELSEALEGLARSGAPPAAPAPTAPPGGTGAPPGAGRPAPPGPGGAAAPPRPLPMPQPPPPPSPQA